MSTKSNSLRKERWEEIKALRFVDFCRALQIGQTTGNELIRSGKVRCVRVLGGRRIPVTEVDRILNSTDQTNSSGE